MFGDDWKNLPKVMREHYGIRPYSDDFVVVEGTLDVTISPFVGVMSRLFGVLISHSGKNVPVSVIFRSGRNSSAFWLDRTFRFPQGDQRFLSHMEHVGGNEMIEFMRYGLGWKTAYAWEDQKVVLSHRGYVWRILGFQVPVPLGLILGRGAAEEIPVSGDAFSMWTHTRHALFGDGLAYSGAFKITKVSCPGPS